MEVGMSLLPMYLEPDCSMGWSGIFILKVMLSRIFFLIQGVIKTILQLRRKSQKSQIYGRVTILMGLIILSCSTMSIDTYHGPQNPIYKESPQAPGFMVYIKPFLNDTETKKYFGVNLLKSNILALYVSASNTNPSKNYILTEDSIKITQNIAEGKINHPEKGSEQAAKIATGIEVGTWASSVGIAATAFSVSYPAWVASGVFIAVPISEYAIPFYVGKQLSDASVIKEHFETQKFRATTLETGEDSSGFIYFNWNDLKKYNEVSLCFIITDSVSNEMYYPCFDVPLQKSEND